MIGVEEVDADFRDLLAANNGVIVRRLVEIDVVLVRVEEVSAKSFTHSLSKSKKVRFIERNALVRLPPFEARPVAEAPEVGRQGIPDDGFWSSDPLTGLGQWNMRVINAPEGWEIQRGDSSILVAVLDTGIRATHLDLLDNYVPLGFNWVDGTSDTSDDNGHGTHVAGIIAAETNNSYGIAGLAQVGVMAEKVLDADGVGTWADTASGIIHAADAGADIICMSLGGYEYSLTAESAVEYAYSKGCLLIASAGNDGVDTPLYPAAFENVVAVGATYGEPDTLAPYSNYGPWMELTAPGGMDKDLDGW
ncbi:MAG: S8 family serine peptidase, partial [Candidatus Bathyarchaeia archaeon]